MWRASRAERPTSGSRCWPPRPTCSSSPPRWSSSPRPGTCTGSAAASCRCSGCWSPGRPTNGSPRSWASPRAPSPPTSSTCAPSSPRGPGPPRRRGPFGWGCSCPPRCAPTGGDGVPLGAAGPSRAERPPGGGQVAVEVAAIAAGVGPVGLEERGRALLDSLRRVVPFQAGWLGLLDPEHREHVPLVVQGYEDHVLSYITGSAIVDEIELVGLYRPRLPMRLCD